jgi:hypothetical protein
MAWKRTPKPDPAIVKDQLQGMQAMLRSWGAEAFMAALFWILSKKPESFVGAKEGTVLVPFRLNRCQKDYETNLDRNNLGLKGRQEGATTYFSLKRILLPAITDQGIGCCLISQSGEYAEKHFQIVRRAYNMIAMDNPFDPSVNLLNKALKNNLLHTAYSNRRELVFDQLQSQISVYSAEVEESAQGATVHHILADEFSRWPGKPEDTLANVRGALTPDGTTDKICTANGAAGTFWEECLRAMNDPANSDAKFFFHPHWWVDDYQLDMTEDEKDELEKDLTSDELKLISQIHKDLSCVT